MLVLRPGSCAKSLKVQAGMSFLHVSLLYVVDIIELILARTDKALQVLVGGIVATIIAGVHYGMGKHQDHQTAAELIQVIKVVLRMSI